MTGNQDTSWTINRIVRALYWHSRTGRAQDATLAGILRLSFGLGYPVVEFVEQIVDLEQEMKSK